MKRILCLIIVMLLLCCGCSSKKANNSTSNNNNSTLNNTTNNIDSFSYKEVCEFYKSETVGIKRSDFVNTEKSTIANSEQAIELAKNECTVEYDTINVAYDSVEKIYQVSFSKEDIVGGNQDIYKPRRYYRACGLR